MVDQNKKILAKTLITGADGMVGNYINFGTKTNHKTLDITNPTETLRIVKKYKPKVIIHLAAATDVNQCEENPQIAYFINTLGTYNMAMASKEVGAKFVYISTSSVFDGQSKTLYSPTDSPKPINHYGKSKYIGELLVEQLFKDFLIVRTCWVFGGGPKKDKKFVSVIMKKIQEKNDMSGVDDIFGSPTYAKDLVDQIKKLILENKKGIYHVSNVGNCSKFDMAKMITSFMKSDIKIKRVSSKTFGGVNQPKNQSLKSNIKKNRTWEKALEEYIQVEWLNIKN
jgi:dTDP-4-dehydrorhamnose reductase